MQIYRAEDGESFQVTETLRDIERLGGLETFLRNVTGVDAAAILAYLSDGRRLRDENIRELAGAPDQSIFVFNKNYLDYELEDVLRTLRVEPTLQPEVAIGDLRRLDVLTDASIAHHDFVAHILGTIHVQHDALRIASTSLELNVLSISDAFETFAGGGRRELEKQSHLLQGLELDLEVIAKIRIHPEFLSPAARRAVEAGEKARVLGDYVSNVKMRQVGEACAKTHNELRKRFEVAEESMTRLSSGADDVRSSIVDSGLVEEADSCMKRTQESVEKITELATQLREPRKDEAELWAELRRDDIALREEVRLIVDIKNKSTVLCMKALRKISHLTDDLMFLPPALASLQTDFRAKTNFAHIQRLHNMLYAYGATLVEIVRRKEFSRFFTQRAHTIAEIMAKLSSNERKRRQIYRGEVHGQLPFDTKGLDDSVPAMEITSTGINNGIYSVERDDLTALLEEIEKIEQAYRPTDGHDAHNALQETRAALEKLINRMDSLETTFDKMAEKTILSASRISLPRRQPTDHTDQEFQEIVEQLHDLQDIRSEQERQFGEERQDLRTEIARLRQELHELRARSEVEATSYRSLNERYTELLSDTEDQRKALMDAEATVSEQTKISDELRQELARTTSDLEEIRRLEGQTAETAAKLRSEKSMALQDLESARARVHDLEAQVTITRAEAAQANKALQEFKEEADRQLRAQASDADRMLRDIIAEADGDRAVLEHQCFEMRATLDSTERELKQARSEIDVSNADVAGLREELQRMEHELEGARRTEDALRTDLHSTQVALVKCQTRLEDSEQLAKDVLQVATTFRESHNKAYAAAQAMSSSSRSLAHLSDSAPSLRSPIDSSPIDPEDVTGGLRILKEYDLTAFNDVISKTGSTIRKWQKQCKEYRDRAKGKISFRNFAKGDLALFLPTRNSVSKPWAAFNVSFPHYFLQATGSLAEQLNSREWIVARIASIAERVADNRDPNSNPYGLSDGTKFYMLQVEDWSQSGPSSRRKTSPPKPSLSQSVQSTPSPPDMNGAEPSTVSPPPSDQTPKPEPPTPTLRHLLGPRPRTHSAPGPQPSSLSKVLAKAPSPIEEVKERASPSPSRLSTGRPSSPLAGLSRSRPVSSSPPVSRPTSPLVSPPLVNPASPLSGTPQPRPSSGLASHARASSPLGGSPGVSPVAGPSHPGSPSPIALPLASGSPSRASPKAGTPPGRGGSRRSSLSSHPSSVFSGGRHAFTSASSTKAVATTALSGGAGTSSVSPPVSRHVSSGSQSREELSLAPREMATPSPEDSPSEGMSSMLLSRRRTTSAAGAGAAASVQQGSGAQPASMGGGSLVKNLTGSWGASFGRKRPTRHSMGASSAAGGARNVDSVETGGSKASEILKRFDDVLPREGGGGSR